VRRHHSATGKIISLSRSVAAHPARFNFTLFNNSRPVTAALD
jgi:hypothetical protein